MTDKLEQLFNLEESNKSTEIVPVDNTKIYEKENYKIARENIIDIVEKGKLALGEILSIAKNSESPRSYEVAATLIKTLGDLNKDIMDIQKKNKELFSDNKTQTENTTNVNILVTTSDLLKEIKKINN